MLHLGDGRYALIECKLGSKEIEDGAKHLVQLYNLIVEGRWCSRYSVGLLERVNPV